MKIHYIIFHPEHERQSQRVNATSSVLDKINSNWQGKIYVDKIGIGNEDPFVFNTPWYYSYCHASQLRKEENRKGYIQNGSWLIFCSGQHANIGILTIDTCFLVNRIHLWENTPLKLPVQFRYLTQTRKNDLWKKHFRFPFHGQHSSVKYTYEAKLWDSKSKYFSFLPYKSNEVRVSFKISELSQGLRNKINSKIKGKYPVDIDDQEIIEILDKIYQLANIKVLKNIIMI